MVDSGRLYYVGLRGSGIFINNRSRIENLRENICHLLWRRSLECSVPAASRLFTRMGLRGPLWMGKIMKHLWWYCFIQNVGPLPQGHESPERKSQAVLSTYVYNIYISFWQSCFDHREGLRVSPSLSVGQQRPKVRMTWLMLSPCFEAYLAMTEQQAGTSCNAQLLCQTRLAFMG